MTNGPPYADRYILDHASVICSLVAPRPGASKSTTTYRKLKSVDSNALRQDLTVSTLCSALRGDADIDAFVQNCNSTLKNLTDQHAPLKTKTIRARVSAL